MRQNYLQVCIPWIRIPPVICHVCTVLSVPLWSSLMRNGRSCCAPQDRKAPHIMNVILAERGLPVLSDVTVAFLDHNSGHRYKDLFAAHGKTVRTTVWPINSKVSVTVTLYTVIIELSPWPTSHPFSWPVPWPVSSLHVRVCDFPMEEYPVDGRTLSVGFYVVVEVMLTTPHCSSCSFVVA